MLPTVQCVGLVPGPGDAALLHGRLWSNMLVFWLQKFVGIDSNGQSRVYNISSGGSGARNIWEKHKVILSDNRHICLKSQTPSNLQIMEII